jgi:ribosomal protein L7/L12
MTEPSWQKSPPLDPELVATARRVLSSGGALDEAASAVLERTRSPIAAIKALREAQPGLSLADVKPIVHRNLSPAQRDAAEQLWDQIQGGSPT